MKLFMLDLHDVSRCRIRDLAGDEIARVFGGGNSPLGGTPDCPDSTTCETTIITPNADGEFSVDCDAG